MLEGAKKMGAGAATIASAGAAVGILVGGAGAGGANSMVTLMVHVIDHVFAVKWSDPIFVLISFLFLSSHTYMYANVLFHKQTIDRVIAHSISLGIPIECSSSPKGLHIIPKCGCGCGCPPKTHSPSA